MKLIMTKSLACADAGMDCSWSGTAESEEELMTKVAEHAKEVHPEMEMTPELGAKIKSLIKEV